MKKIVVILGLCLFCYGQVWAEEIKTEQSISNDQTYLTGNFQQQAEPQKQKIGNHFSFFTINIQVVRPLQVATDAVR